MLHNSHLVYKRSNEPGPDCCCGCRAGAIGAGKPPLPIGDNGLGDDLDEEDCCDVFIAFIDTVAFF